MTTPNNREGFEDLPELPLPQGGPHQMAASWFTSNQMYEYGEQCRALGRAERPAASAMDAPFGNCGAVRRASGLSNFKIHLSHTMHKPLTGLTAFDNSCVNCGGRMWGVPDDWQHDILLEQRCSALAQQAETADKGAEPVAWRFRSGDDPWSTVSIDTSGFGEEWMRKQGWEVERLYLAAPPVAAIPERVRLVPKEATSEMIKATSEAFKDINAWCMEMQTIRGRKWTGDPNDPPMNKAWRAMLAAAPTVPEGS